MSQYRQCSVNDLPKISGVHDESTSYSSNHRSTANRTSKTVNPLLHRRTINRLNRISRHISPYILRSTKLNSLPGTISFIGTMDSSPFLVNSTGVTQSYESALLEPNNSLPHNLAVQSVDVPPVSSISILNYPVGMNPSTPGANSLNSAIPDSHNYHVQSPQTIFIDGKTYRTDELVAVIDRLKSDVRTCTDRINWLEAELQHAKLTLTARDRDIHKLRSVLDQKVSSTTFTITNNSNPVSAMQHSEHTNENIMNAFRAQPVSPNDLQRVKKQGVSGEPQNFLQTSGMIHHPKDIRSSQLIRDAIENNDFLRHIDKTQVEEIVRCMYKKHIPQFSYVIREGQAGDALYVVAEGVLEVTKDDQVLGRMDVGRSFGELALLYNCNRTASVRALTKASAWTLDRRVFQQIMMSVGIHQHEENFHFLSSVPALRSLAPAKMHKLADVLEAVYYGPDEHIIREGEIGETFFIIKSGTVRITKTINDQQESQEIRQLHEGDWFGEKALYTSDKRSANVISVKPGVHLLSLDRSNFIHLIGDLTEIRTKDYGDSESQTSTRSSFESDIGGSAAVLSEPPQFEPSVLQVKREEFEPVSVIGIGGFGCVELVVWTKDRTKSFAMKRMKKHHIVHTRQQEHICSERQIMLQLRSPFICRLYCTYKDKQFVYMLMEACLGGELWTVLRNCGRFNDTVTRFTVACVLEAFTYLHSQGIIYRDLKPENLLLDNRGYIKLCDFGFAKRIGQGKKTWTFCGTPEYVAPEIILNKGHDYSADYWSLGILIFELLTGSPPFTGSDPMKIYNVVLRGIDAVEFPTAIVGRTASALIRRLCMQNPAQRLGYGLGGIVEIKQHKYFQGFDWIGLHRRTVIPPIVPKISGPLDSSNFDKYPEKIENPPEENSGWDADF